MKITSIQARSIFDSRGNPTIEVELGSGTLFAHASVPSGKSAGSKEAHEKRDADGGVEGVIKSITECIIPALIMRDFSYPDEIDAFVRELDGTPDKSNLGANALLAVSIAATKLFALAQGKRLWKYIADMNGFEPKFPRLYMNVLNGGAHADFHLPFQEYILVAEGRPHEAYDRATMVFWELGQLLKETIGNVSLGDEGGYMPKFGTIEKPFELLRTLVFPGDEISLAIDAAASEFYNDGAYRVLDKQYSTDELLRVYQDLVARFGLISIEDPFAENDKEGFKKMTATLGNRILVVGDDLTVTNPGILKSMIAEKAGNALIVKPNQIGTLQEVYDAVRCAHDAGWSIIASHRSGETGDSFIADLAVGIGAFGLKAGAPSQKERVAKYDRLLEIEREFDMM
jgi:enolase